MTDFLNRYFTQIALVFIFALYFFFGLQHIGQFITADEHYWVYERIPQYWRSIAEGKWKKTFINDKPGVSLALVSGIGLFFEPHPETICSKDADEITRCDVIRAERTLFVFRLPLLLINAVLLFCCFWLISKLYNTETALLATAFIAFSPILIGITQIVNPDALLWSFGTAAFLAFLALLKLRERKFILIAGIFLGFAILSKYTASFFFPFFSFLVVTDILFTKRISTAVRSAALENISFFLGVSVVSIFIISLFLPAIWLKPSILGNLLSGGEAYFSILPFLFLFLFAVVVIFYEKIIILTAEYAQKIQIKRWIIITAAASFIIISAILIIGRTSFPDWELFEKMPFDLKDLYSSDKPNKAYIPNIMEAVLLEFNPLVFSLPPIILIIFGVQFLIGTLSKRFRELIPNESFENFALLMFIFFFFIAIIFSEVLATARYLILIFPVVSILAALSMSGIFQFFPRRFFIFRNFVAIGVIGFLLTSTTTSLPFPFNYTNGILPKNQIVHHSWGYGGYEAAQYLNTLPNAENMLVWSDYYGVCEFFKGKCITMEYEMAAKQQFDYAIISWRGEGLYRPEHIRWQKSKNLQMSGAYLNSYPVWQLFIGDRQKNFVKVVKINNK